MKGWRRLERRVARGTYWMFDRSDPTVTTTPAAHAAGGGHATACVAASIGWTDAGPSFSAEATASASRRCAGQKATTVAVRV